MYSLDPEIEPFLEHLSGKLSSGELTGFPGDALTSSLREIDKARSPVQERSLIELKKDLKSEWSDRSWGALEEIIRRKNVDLLIEVMKTHPLEGGRRTTLEGLVKISEVEPSELKRIQKAFWDLYESEKGVHDRKGPVATLGLRHDILLYFSKKRSPKAIELALKELTGNEKEISMDTLAMMVPNYQPGDLNPDQLDKLAAAFKSVEVDSPRQLKAKEHIDHLRRSLSQGTENKENHKTP